jgi:hypothetical protein
VAELAATPRSRRSVPALLTALRDPYALGRAKRKIASRCVLDLGRGFDSLVFLAGTGRSGTTWLAVDADNSARVVFEPCMPDVGAFGAHVPPQYIRPEEDDPKLVEGVCDVLLDRVASVRWTGRSNNRLDSAVAGWQYGPSRAMELFGLGERYGREVQPLLPVGVPVFESSASFASCSG